MTPRAGIAILIKPGFVYIVRHVINEIEGRTNGVIQTMTVDRQGGVRVTGAYMSPGVPGAKAAEVLQVVISDRS